MDLIGVSPDGLRRLEANSETADFEIICGERRWRLHRALLIVHSPVLEKVCTGAFKEAKEATLDLSEEDQYLVAGMIRFFYTGSCGYVRSIVDMGFECCHDYYRGRAKFFLNMYLFADKYDVPALRDQARKKAVQSTMELREREKILEIATLAYEGLPGSKDIYDAAVGKIADWWATDLEHNISGKDEDIENIVDDHPHLAVGVVRLLSKALRNRGLRWCEEINAFYFRLKIACERYFSNLSDYIRGWQYQKMEKQVNH